MKILSTALHHQRLKSVFALLLLMVAIFVGETAAQAQATPPDPEIYIRLTPGVNVNVKKRVTGTATVINTPAGAPVAELIVSLNKAGETAALRTVQINSGGTFNFDVADLAYGDYSITANMVDNKSPMKVNGAAVTLDSLGDVVFDKSSVEPSTPTEGEPFNSDLQARFVPKGITVDPGSLTWEWGFADKLKFSSTNPVVPSDWKDSAHYSVILTPDINNPDTVKNEWRLYEAGYYQVKVRATAKFKVNGEDASVSGEAYVIN